MRKRLRKKIQRKWLAENGVAVHGRRVTIGDIHAAAAYAYVRREMDLIGHKFLPVMGGPFGRNVEAEYLCKAEDE